MKKIIIILITLFIIAGCEKEDESITKKLICSGSYEDIKEEYNFEYNSKGKVLRTASYKMTDEVDTTIMTVEDAVNDMDKIICHDDTGNKINNCVVTSNDKDVIVNIKFDVDTLDSSIPFKKDTTISNMEKVLNSTTVSSNIKYECFTKD